jgi:diaminopimelate epimerase
MTMLPFIKMHGLGNDFVIFDARKSPLTLTPEQCRHIAHRQTGVGCDQIIVMENSEQADCFMRIYNSDGSFSGACGNATRCVADRLMKENGKDAVTIETLRGVLPALRETSGEITVDMGRPLLRWDDIPLARECDTLHVPMASGALSDGVGVSMGNPHVVFFVPDPYAIDLARDGKALEHDPLLPERGNIGVAAIKDRSHITLRVWERGSGETLACGSGACACLVAAVRRNLTDRKAAISLPGGVLTIEWREADNHVWMTGAVAEVFEGKVALT